MTSTLVKSIAHKKMVKVKKFEQKYHLCIQQNQLLPRVMYRPRTTKHVVTGTVTSLRSSTNLNSTVGTFGFESGVVTSSLSLENDPENRFRESIGVKVP